MILYVVLVGKNLKPWLWEMINQIVPDAKVQTLKSRCQPLPRELLLLVEGLPEAVGDQNVPVVPAVVAVRAINLNICLLIVMMRYEATLFS